MFSVILITDIKDYTGELEFDPSPTGNRFIYLFLISAHGHITQGTCNKDVPVCI
jgi:hypothetical protein